MREHQSKQDRRVADSVAKGWVERAPRTLRPFLRLARYDRPVGFWLLAIPCWQGLALARITVPVTNLVLDPTERTSPFRFYQFWINTPDQDVVRPADKPITVTGGVVGLKGNLAPEGAIVKVAGAAASAVAACSWAWACAAATTWSSTASS